MSVIGTYRSPFSLGSPLVFDIPEKTSVSDIVTSSPLPADFTERGGIVMISGGEVPRALWGMVKPKAPAELTFHMPIHGGGGDGGGGKETLATVAALALTVVTGGIAGGGLSGVLGANFAAGTLGATALAAGVSLAGSLLLGGLISPPVSADTSIDRSENRVTSLSGNVLASNGPIPRVIGTRVIHPPLVSEPYFYYENGDEKVEAVYCLAGPHDLSDVRVDGVDASDAEDVEVQTREGWNSDDDQTILTKQSKITVSQLQIAGHVLDPENQTELDPLVTASNATPQWHGMVTGNDPREFQVQLFMPEGLHQDGSSTVDVRVPFRIRFRKRGDVSWNNGPELHYMNATPGQIRTTLRFRFEAWDSIIPTPPSAAGWVEARKNSDGQIDAPATSDWDAAAYFSGGAGNDVLRAGTESSTNLESVKLYTNEAIIYLDPATYTSGDYEIEVKRGHVFRNADWVSSSYQYDGDIRDFFHYFASSGVPTIALDQKPIGDTIYIQRGVSLWEQAPVQGKGLALIAIRATNRKVSKVTVTASGYVKDYGGSAWDTWATTSNPAPHYRDILVGDLNADALPENLVDDADLVSWRTACASLGYECNLVVEGSRLNEVLRIVSSCGYARPYQSEIWGVVRDFDRSSDSPIQLFTPRNSSGFRFKKAFPRLPDGLRVNFPNASVDDAQTQVIQYRDDANPGDVSKLEQVSYLGITDETKVRERADFDLKQGKHRSTFYELTAPVESIRCRRGDMVAVQHDIIASRAGFARITAVTLDGSSDIQSIDLDSSVSASNETELLSVADVLDVDDMLDVGRQTGVAIRRTDGTVTVHEVSNVTGDATTLTFSPSIPATATIATGCLVSVGNLGVEYLRLIVSAITPGPDLTANMVMVPEAPELWS